MSRQILITGGAGFLGSHLADVYELDWARTFGLLACVFRMSCMVQADGGA